MPAATPGALAVPTDGEAVGSSARSMLAPVQPQQVSGAMTGISGRLADKFSTGRQLGRQLLAVAVGSPTSLGTTTAVNSLYVPTGSSDVTAVFPVSGGFRLVQNGTVTDLTSTAYYAYGVARPSGGQDVILYHADSTATMVPVSASGVAGPAISLGAHSYGMTVFEQPDGSRVVLSLIGPGGSVKFQSFTVAANGTVSARQDITGPQAMSFCGAQVLGNTTNLLAYRVAPNTYAQVISSTGAPVGSPAVMTSTSNYSPPQFSMSDAGNGMVRMAWASGNGLYTQLYNSTSQTPVGSPVLIASTTGSFPYAAVTLTKGANGGFIATAIANSNTAVTILLDANGNTMSGFPKTASISGSGTLATSAAQTASGVVMVSAVKGSTSTLLTYSNTATQLGPAQT
ncbi:MAG: hypothetical protein AAB066_01285, partial [Candidatus Margulisiibacteriota bacterium]